jgi:hypothetical protein
MGGGQEAFFLEDLVLEVEGEEAKSGGLGC